MSIVQQLFLPPLVFFLFSTCKLNAAAFKSSIIQLQQNGRMNMMGERESGGWGMEISPPKTLSYKGTSYSSERCGMGELCG